jgi:hypothetical protein
MSPLNQFQDVYFVRNEDDLKNALIKLFNSNRFNNNLEYFWTDNNLPKWQKLLNDIYSN